MAIDLELGDRLALLAQGLDQLDVGFSVFDHELLLVASNRQFQQLLHFPDALCKAGAGLQDMLHHNAMRGEYGPGDVDTQVRERMALAHRFVPHRFERIRPDGTIIEVCGTPLDGGGMVTTYTDVTVPRQREAALRELSAELEIRVQQRTAELEHREAELAHKAALLELVIRNVNQGISFVNADLVLELCNDKFGELLDLPPELSRPGVSFVDVAYFNARRGEYGPGDPRTLVEQRIEMARQGVAHHFERTRPISGKTLEVMGRPTANGGMVTTYSDISERKDAESRILKLNETLEERVAERSLQLQQAMQTLHASQEALARSAANATLGTLVASVSHELNTPLGNSLIAVSTCADLSKRFAQLADAGQMKRSDLSAFVLQMQDGCALIERSLHRAVDLMKNFTQVAADQASEQRRSFDLGAVAHEVLDTLRPSLKRHPHVVELDIEEGLRMDSFPGALGQVFINLINNAYLHAFEGRSDGLVCIRAVAHDQGVDLQVSDNGSGMTQAHLAQLFQPFFSTKIGRGGTGLGTTIIENLVIRVLGGTLRVASSVGEGTTFNIHLPLRAPEHKS